MATVILYVSFAFIVGLSSAQNPYAPGGALLDNKLKFLTSQPFNDFDWKLSKALDKNEQGNFVVSTLSVKLAIAMLYLGLQGPAAREIEDALRINSTLKETVEQKFSSIMKSLEVKDEAFELNIGTKLFLDKTSQLNLDFEKKLKDYYNSSVKQIDFKQQSAAVAEINNWCNHITKGKIPQLISQDEINDGTAMMLLNAIYFRADWEIPFSETETKYDTFQSSSKKPVKVQMMSLVDTLCYINIPELKAELFRLPYKGSKFAMYIIYPYEVDGLSNLTKDINPVILARALEQMQEQKISLRFPKFKFESTASLVPILKLLNIKELFSEKANLENIARSTKGPLMVSNIIQKSGIEVNEKGSTAYASTNVLIDTRITMDAIEISVTHPFLFLIADEKKDNIVFIGKVIDPSTFNFPPPSGLPDVINEELANRVQPEPPLDLNDKYNYFDKELLLRAAQANSNKNIVLSPASIKASLALLLEGASGITEKELIEALRLPKNKQEAVAVLQSTLNSLKNANSLVNIESKNKIFITQDERLSQQYNDVITNQYDSQIEQINFAKPEDATNIINRWVNNVTRGLIPTLVSKDDLDSSTRLFLANCIYFKGDWQTAFEPKNSFPDCFFGLDHSCQRTTFMRNELTLNAFHSRSLDAKFVEIPFKDDRYSMIIALPNKEDGVYSLLKDLHHRSLLEFFAQMKKSVVNLILPRTTIEFATPLATALQQLDIKDLFSPSANLTGVLDMKKPISVKNIVHKAKIEFNEKGAQAAAATGVQVVLLSASFDIEFRANHPFLFVIRDKQEAGFLFEGIVITPEAAESKPVYSSTRVIPPAAIAATRRPIPSTQRPVKIYQSPRPTEKGSVEYPIRA